MSLKFLVSRGAIDGRRKRRMTGVFRFPCAGDRRVAGGGRGVRGGRHGGLQRPIRHSQYVPTRVDG